MVMVEELVTGPDKEIKSKRKGGRRRKDGRKGDKYMCVYFREGEKWGGWGRRAPAPSPVPVHTVRYSPRDDKLIPIVSPTD